MAGPVALHGVLVVFVVVFSLLISSSAVHSQSIAPAPAPVSDGTSIDQGVAYVLMFMALAVTYLVHPLGASTYSFI